MPDKKMILTQNLVFNLPMCLVMTLTAAFKSGAGLNPGTIIQYVIGLAAMEFLGAVIPTRKISTGITARFFPGRNPLEFPQILLSTAVLSLLFTIPMSLVMTAVGLLMAPNGPGLSVYPFAVLRILPWTYIASFLSVLIFLPLSMKVSGLDKMGPPRSAGGKNQT